MYIRNITKIETIAAKSLNGLSHPCQFGAKIPASAQFTIINTKGLPNCEISEKIDNGVRQFTTKLTFKTCDRLDITGTPIAFRFTSTDGNAYLVGRPQAPYPVLTLQETFPSSHTESSLNVYTLTWTDTVKPLTIL